MYKRKNDSLIKKAEEALLDERVSILNRDKFTIKDSYNGQTTAFSVTVAMSGIRPALAIYQKKTDGCDRLEILNAIAVMLNIPLGLDQNEKPGRELFRTVLNCNDEELKRYKKDIIDCSIALKQVIRTYKLVK